LLGLIEDAEARRREAELYGDSRAVSEPEDSHSNKPDDDANVPEELLGDSHSDKAAATLDAIKDDLMGRLHRGAFLTTHPEHPKVCELFRDAHKLAYTSAGPKPKDGRRVSKWKADREANWAEFCGGKDHTWKWPDGMVMAMSPEIAAGYIKLARAI
jgi:hypothetical protein